MIACADNQRGSTPFAFDHEISDPNFKGMNPYSIQMSDEEDTPQLVLRIVFALASERPSVKFAHPQLISPSRIGHLMHRAAARDISFPLINGDLGPWRRLLGRPRDPLGTPHDI